MKIGIVLYPTYGGSGVVATELGKALAAKGHEVHFITYSQPVRLDTFEENIFFHEVSVSAYPLFEYQPYETVLASKLVDVVKFEKLDLLHVHYAIPHASAAYMAKQILLAEGIYIPFITTLHGTDITLVGKDPSFQPVITFCLNQSDAVTSVSQSLKEDTYKHFNTSIDIRVIPNFICPDDYQIPFEHSFRQKYANDNEFILCHISNFRKVKRIEDVIRVFKIVEEQIPAKLLLVGDGPERTNIECLARELGVYNKIIFLGKLQNTARPLSISDLFLLPSQTESFGLAALEAMAAGVPVISSNTGGIPEVNLQGFSGFLSDVGDVEDMAKNALSILKSGRTLKLMKQQAFEQANKFSINEILPMYEALYEEVLANSPKK
ncbi:MAG: N-acetyl-alpha-D-glucosaminyl L-malate synthase BshA [Crocinitomicaceae bacterium]